MRGFDVHLFTYLLIFKNASIKINAFCKISHLTVQLTEWPAFASVGTTFAASTLKFRHVRGHMIEVYKLFNNMYDSVTTGWLTDRYIQINYDMRVQRHSLYQSQIRYDTCKYSFSNRIIPLWNSLPETVVSSSTVTRKCTLWRCKSTPTPKAKLLWMTSHYGPTVVRSVTEIPFHVFIW